MNTLKLSVFILAFTALVPLAGAAQNNVPAPPPLPQVLSPTMEGDYMAEFAQSFINPYRAHRATNLFWSLCLGIQTELSDTELSKRYNLLATDTNARVAFYKRFNYYLSGKVGYYTDVLTLQAKVKKSKENPEGWEDVFDGMKAYAMHIHSYGQDAILQGSWNTGPASPVGDTSALKVYGYAEVMPEFPGGEEALIKFLVKHIIYPKVEQENDIQGKVLLRFRVCEDGYLCTADAVKTATENLETEAIRVLKMMPNFKPGSQDGKNVSVWFNLPIIFRLQ